ncbi:MAG: ribonuclease III [Candidatus Paceibacterota bacterium]|jgi:ribonuclease-3
METVELERQLGVVFRDKNLLMQALTHRSYLNENRKWPVPHNERLELLGDAVLELVVTEYLLKVFPKESEGRLTELRSALVCISMLSQIAEDLRLHRFLFLSRGQLKDNDRAQQKIYGDAVEAILGALYLDQGLVEVERLVSRLFFRELMDVIRAGTKHPKMAIQEFAQKHFGITPSYRTIEATGPDHEKVFRVAVCLGSNVLTTGSGPSKLEAETEAAKVGYAVLRFKLRSVETLKEG